MVDAPFEERRYPGQAASKQAGKRSCVSATRLADDSISHYLSLGVVDAAFCVHDGVTFNAPLTLGFVARGAVS